MENERRFESVEEYQEFIANKIKGIRNLDYLDYISTYIELSINWIKSDSE